jgi:hypothetical protein
MKMDDHHSMVKQKAISERTGPSWAKGVPYLVVVQLERESSIGA